MKENWTGAVRIGVNAHLLSLAQSYRSAGINGYLQQLLRRLPEADPTLTYTVFTGERRYTGAAGVDVRHSRWPTQRPALRIAWEQVVQPGAARRAHVDLLHEPAFVGPVVGGPPFVVTVHDLSFLLYPRAFRPFNRIYLRLVTNLSVQKAKRVIAVSENTKQDLVRTCHLSPNKIDVIYNGLDECFQPLPKEQVEQFRARRGLPERFILFVGTLEPRKNVLRLIEAYAQLPKDRPPLLLVGGKGWLYDEVFALVADRALTDEVRFVGYVPAEDLPWWYNAAEVFVYPSLYEGFGLPPLEAMACGTPVITSDASSLPEVVGQAALRVDPNDTGMLAQAMERALTDRELYEQLRTAGLVRARGFAWAKTVRHTAQSYRRALNLPGGDQDV